MCVRPRERDPSQGRGVAEGRGHHGLCRKCRQAGNGDTLKRSTPSIRTPDPFEGGIGEPSPLDRFRMRVAADRAGVQREPARTLARSPVLGNATKASLPVDSLVPSSDEVLTREETATLLKICTKTVSRLVEREGLPAARVGREYRFRRSAVLAWMAERESSGAK